MIGICEWCGTEFKTFRSKRQRFCSKSCRAFWQAVAHPQSREPRKPLLICELCGHPFQSVWTRAGGTRFCSSACFGAALRGTGKETTYPKLNGRHAHRAVAEQMLGRPLRRGEVVHHRDGDKTNYDPSNLQVLPSQAAHAALHKKEGTE
jgi:hypothetical protein